MNVDSNKFLNTKKASEYLGISQNALRIKVSRGQLKPQYFLGRYRFRKDYLDSLMRNSRLLYVDKRNRSKW